MNRTLRNKTFEVNSGEVIKMKGQMEIYSLSELMETIAAAKIRLTNDHHFSIKCIDSDSTKIAEKAVNDFADYVAKHHD